MKTTQEFDPTTDLRISRVIKAPRSAVWECWADPALLGRWWIPEPLRCRVTSLELRPGGGFVSELSGEGIGDGSEWLPHTDDAFLEVEPQRRLVFTNVVDAAQRPVSPEPVALVAVVELLDHPEGTEYVATVRHPDEATRLRHEELGFQEGWGAVIGQLAALAEHG